MTQSNLEETVIEIEDTMGDVQIPKKHKAIVYDKPGSISTKIEELDVPEPGPGEVLINLYVHDINNPTVHPAVTEIP